jgi:hypothetical protein
LVYDELRKLAAQKLAQEKPGQTLEATALVHEAYVRLVDIIAKLHAKKPEDRFQTAKEVAELLGQRLADVQAGRAIEWRPESANDRSELAKHSVSDERVAAARERVQAQLQLAAKGLLTCGILGLFMGWGCWPGWHFASGVRDFARADSRSISSSPRRS